MEHIPVMLSEVVASLNLKQGNLIVDCTLGGGGHTAEIVKNIGNSGKVLGIDRDSYAIERCRKIFGGLKEQVLIEKGNYSELGEILKKNNFEMADGILLDLGVSTFQIEDSERGFAFDKNCRLDMRMDRENKLTAAGILETYSEEELSELLRKYSDERYSRQIARAIKKSLNNKSLESTGDLKEIVKNCYLRFRNQNWLKGVARVFQAIRIEVNGELLSLGFFLDNFTRWLKSGGRLLVISFHSAEDSLVKKKFQLLAKPCCCPPDFPQCACGKKSIIKVVGKFKPEEKEVRLNPRSRSAILRVAEVL